MIQVLYVFLSMMIVTMFAIGQRSAIFQAHRMAMQGDIDLLGAGVAVEQLDFISVQPFDANIPVADSTAFTPYSDFGLGSTSYLTSTDIDDFDGKTLVVFIPTLIDTFSFDVSAEVRYVQKSGSGFIQSTIQTYFKEVSIKVDGELNSEVTMSRIVSY